MNTVFYALRFLDWLLTPVFALLDAVQRRDR